MCWVNCQTYQKSYQKLRDKMIEYPNMEYLNESVQDSDDILINSEQKIIGKCNLLPHCKCHFSVCVINKQISKQTKTPQKFHSRR